MVWTRMVTEKTDRNKLIQYILLTWIYGEEEKKGSRMSHRFKAIYPR